MSFYLDTSLVVPAFTQEPSTDRVLEWLQSHRNDLFISDWVIAELSAALSTKVRTGSITPAERSAATAAFDVAVVDSFSRVEIERGHFLLAARFADNSASKLRAGDALHLAIAAQNGLTLCTLDHTLAAAGPVLGVETLLL